MPVIIPNAVTSTEEFRACEQDTILASIGTDMLTRSWLTKASFNRVMDDSQMICEVSKSSPGIWHDGQAVLADDVYPVKVAKLGIEYSMSLPGISDTTLKSYHGTWNT